MKPGHDDRILPLAMRQVLKPNPNILSSVQLADLSSRMSFLNQHGTCNFPLVLHGFSRSTYDTDQNLPNHDEACMIAGAISTLKSRARARRKLAEKRLVTLSLACMGTSIKTQRHGCCFGCAACLNLSCEHNHCQQNEEKCAPSGSALKGLHSYWWNFNSVAP